MNRYYVTRSSDRDGSDEAENRSISMAFDLSIWKERDTSWSRRDVLAQKPSRKREGYGYEIIQRVKNSRASNSLKAPSTPC